MNRQKYLGDNDNLLTKIDDLLQHSRATRQRFARINQQRGGAIPGFVSLDTPVNDMTGGAIPGYVNLDTPVNNMTGGGSGSIDSEFDRTDASLAKADALLAAFNETDDLMIGGGCGCGGEEVYPYHTADCGSRSYRQKGGARKSKNLKKSKIRPRHANLLSDLERDLNEADSLLNRF